MLFKKTFNKIFVNLKSHAHSITQVQTDVSTLTCKQKQNNQDIQDLKAKVSILLDIRERKESNEPWIDLVGGDIDSEKGLEMKLDWNDAFIEQLRAKGYRGTTETALVGQYLLQVGKTVERSQSGGRSETIDGVSE